MQRCMHGDVGFMGNNMSVNYKGALLQVLLDMADWLQEGKEPLASTVYRMEGNQVLVEEDPAARKGMQAGVRLTANGQKCAHVRAGEEFTLRCEAILPEGSGEITSVWYDFHDTWHYSGEERQDVFPVEGDFRRTLENGVHGAVSEIRHRFPDPGTYSYSLRVTSQRQGDRRDIFTQVKNLDRARIVVE